MRKIVAQEMVSVDGFFAGPGGELDWFVWDDVLRGLSLETLRGVDTLLFGRVTYEMMAAYWPTTTDEPAIRDRMNAYPKLVFSRTLGTAGWNNTRILREIDPPAIRRMKEQPGKDMVVYGSGALVSALAREKLIDEYRLIENPVVLGEGKPLFTGLAGALKLELLESRSLGSGNVLLRYRPAQVA